MKQWIFTGACIALVAAFSSTYAASGSATADKIQPTGDLSIRTGYELRVIGTEKNETLNLLEKKINENGEILKQGACERVKIKKGKGAPSISIGCDKPNAKTDDFFRSLLLDASTEKSGQGPTLRTYSLALPSTCKLEYCCGVSQLESCKKINPTKPCTVCPTR